MHINSRNIEQTGNADKPQYYGTPGTESPSSVYEIEEQFEDDDDLEDDDDDLEDDDIEVDELVPDITPTDDEEVIATGDIEEVDDLEDDDLDDDELDDDEDVKNV